MKDFWNSRYAHEEYVYGKAPNVFFAQQLDRLEPGRLLLPLEGEGRNAVYAAEMGWQVDAFDFSEQGRQKALQLAQEKKVELNYQVHDAMEYNPLSGTYDAVGLVFAHFPSSVRGKFHSKMQAALKPGGYLIVEAFNKNQIHNKTGGPPNEDMLYTKKDLQDDFQMLEILYLEEMFTEIKEGPFHSGKAEVVKMLGKTVRKK